MIKKVTVICENSVQTPLPVAGEHGLSFYIEGDEGDTLFDTGQGIGLLHNMKMLGKDASGIKRIILSHGHYDHTGGLLPLLEEIKTEIPVYLHPAAFNEKSALLPSGDLRNIGFQASREVYESKGASFREIPGFAKVADSVYAISDIKHHDGWKAWDTRLMRKTDNGISADPFEDDLSLILETAQGPVVLLGCAHAGIIEILESISKETGYKSFHAVIGGTHLDSAPAGYVKGAVEALKEYKVQVIAVSHCTGFRVACMFAHEFKDKFINASVGRIFEF